MTPALTRHLINLWPPFLLAGIHVTSIRSDWRELTVELRDRLYNRNIMGTHFGGSLYAMTDPWYMVMLMHILGPDYYVWDQGADIRFVKPGRGAVSVRFCLSETQIREIRDATADGRKALPEFDVEVLDAAGEIVATVHKTVYVRRKPAARPKLLEGESS
ncbi:DUF4442 domain-containing protein [Chitinibacteraceae bacterium HSL-7]